jgi:hypothetical protein
MAKLLDRIAKDLNQSGYTKRSVDARKWLQSRVLSLGTVSRTSLINDPQRSTSDATVGLFHMFFYDPKLKQKLPYYDKFPLVLPIEGYSDGFLGLNFHYLPINLRVHLLDKLYDLVNNTRFDMSTRIQASYKVLNAASRYKEFKPCLKRYLSDHIASRMVAIEPEHWETAIFLPVQMFTKASAQEVWAESRNKI